ncbi:hypothetical protein SAMN05421736_1355 [Evansella caseinilytica]|uniref:Uncharacterized protein n=1 Tax=Evansella caseinilytica TaxID=1503961 RepID=A0A1H3V318_9BACI|nr:hypothetical protein [Evansella caseinilytica]SDZ68449.1 hypothetical protein SAMN05421736_1355 [Evansella caseinilytica]
MEESDVFEFLSLTIEEEANETLLLPVNNNRLRGKTGIKAVILQKGTENILYIEDELKDYQLSREILSAKIDIEKEINNFGDDITNEVSKLYEQKEAIERRESWFLPYINKDMGVY